MTCYGAESLLFGITEGFATAAAKSLQLCPTLCDPMDCSISGLPAHQQLLEFTLTQDNELVMPFNHLILCHPLLFHLHSFPE